MPSTARHVATKLVDESWFIEGRRVLSRDGEQVATITELEEARLERRVGDDPEEWEVVFEVDDFDSLQVLDDDAFADSMPAGILDADPDDDPPPGQDYMMLVICRIEFTARYGGHEAGKVFRRAWNIPASALTAPAD